MTLLCDITTHVYQWHLKVQEGKFIFTSS